MSAPYYVGREAALAEIFGATSVAVLDDAVEFDGRRFPLVDDVIVTVEPGRLPPRARAMLGTGDVSTSASGEFAEDIQFTFGEEWWAHGEVLPEHQREFEAYFDLVDRDDLSDKRVADLGCGSGRWASFVAPRCREVVAVDFSDAIFVARRNLREHDNVVFVLGDVLDLPLADDSVDLAYCLGVLHHLPVDALDACRRLARLGPELLVYLYYALDNRPPHYRLLLRAVSGIRTGLARIRSGRARAALSWVIAALVYWPLARLGRALGDRGRAIPLADTYGHSTLGRMRQDAYDRFFTRIEQRFTREQIRTLTDTFDSVAISDGLPYWHFLLRRGT